MDIPTQKEMLAMYRCDEISAEVFRNFSATTSSWKKSLESGEILEDFGKKGFEAFKNALGN